MSLSKKQRKFSKYVGQLINWAYEQGYEITLGEVLRTPEQQKLYVEQGKSKTNNSKHLYKLAIDINLFINGQYMTDKNSYEPLGDFWKSLDPDNVWGGDWGWDGGHFQYTK